MFKLWKYSLSLPDSSGSKQMPQANLRVPDPMKDHELQRAAAEACQGGKRTFVMVRGGAEMSGPVFLPADSRPGSAPQPLPLSQLHKLPLPSHLQQAYF